MAGEQHQEYRVMTEQEAIFRTHLSQLHSIATGVARCYHYDQIMFNVWPESQAQAILEGRSYSVAAALVTSVALAFGDLDIDEWKFNPDTGQPLTREEALEYLYRRQEKYLRIRFDPLDIYLRVIMPLIKAWLEEQECIMVEQGYRLPMWERPEWLKETH